MQPESSPTEIRFHKKKIKNIIHAQNSVADHMN
jgi:hypothetical protein